MLISRLYQLRLSAAFGRNNFCNCALECGYLSGNSELFFFQRLQFQEFMRNIKSGHNGDAVYTDDITPVADFAHFLIQILGGCEQRLFFFIFTGYLVVAVKNIDGNGERIHWEFSIALRREIMASTRVRAFSFFSIKFARSVTRVSCWLRRDLFSVFSRSHRLSSSCSWVSKDCSSSAGFLNSGPLMPKC